MRLLESLRRVSLGGGERSARRLSPNVRSSADPVLTFRNEPFFPRHRASQSMSLRVPLAPGLWRHNCPSQDLNFFSAI